MLPCSSSNGVRRITSQQNWEIPTRLLSGDEVFVVGAPYGISNTLTAGHVSARRPQRDKSQVATALELLQTDAAVNTGNSGSPLFNMKGEIVGIVTNIMSRSGGSEG